VCIIGSTAGDVLTSSSYHTNFAASQADWSIKRFGINSAMQAFSRRHGDGGGNKKERKYFIRWRYKTEGRSIDISHETGATGWNEIYTIVLEFLFFSMRCIIGFLGRLKGGGMAEAGCS
jgi:hypothetical protein